MIIGIIVAGITGAMLGIGCLALLQYGKMEETVMTQETELMCSANHVYREGYEQGRKDAIEEELCWHYIKNGDIPKAEGSYLVCIIGEWSGNLYRTIGGYNEKKNKWAINGCKMEPFCWMPLPKAPQK